MGLLLRKWGRKAMALLVFAISSIIICGKESLNADEAKGKKEQLHPNHWLFLYYHKSGHDVALSLAETIPKAKGYHCDAAFGKLERRVDARIDIDRLAKLDIAAAEGDEMAFSWSSDLLKDPSQSLKVLHFVRDPYDMIVSGYLYHAQDPSPPPEVWLHFPDFDPCEMYDVTSFDRYVSDLSAFAGVSSEDLRSQFMDVQQYCIDLMKKATVLNGGVYPLYPKALQNFHDPFDAVFLEAARALLVKRNGDLPRMACNSLYETRSNAASMHGNVSMRLYTSEFPLSDKEKYRQTCTKAFSFLMDTARNDKHSVKHVQETHPPFWTCMTVSEAVEGALAPAPFHEHNNVHFTHDRVSEQERQSWEDALRKHSILGPVLDIIERAVYS